MLKQFITMSEQNYLVRKSEAVAFLLGIILVISVFSNIKFEGFRTDVLGGDARGYYAWLPAVFIHDSLDFSQVLEQQKKIHGEHFQGHYYSEYNGIKINKYTAGAAFLLLPFFLLAMLLSCIFGFPVDGYSIFFQYGIVAGGILYALLGLYFSFKLLQAMGFEKRTSATGILIFLLGTNLFYYSFLHPGMSHVYSFSMAAMFMYFSWRVMQELKMTDIFLASIAFGLSLFIRPFNVFLILLLPFLAGSAKVFATATGEIFKKPVKLLLALLPALIIMGIQVLLYYLQTGQLWIWSYPGEGFNFDEPRIIDVLFSYRKGLFVYTPLLLLSVIGLVPLFRRNIFRGINALLFLIVLTYFISCWWNWFYGDSFGMRPYIDYYALFIILFAYLHSAAGKAIKNYLIMPLLFLLMILNLIQSYQYHNGIIHHDAMSKEKYWYVFLKTGAEYENILGDTQEALFQESPLQALDTFNISFDSIPDYWSVTDTLIIENPLDSTNLVYLMDSAITFSATFKLKEDTLVFNNKELWSEVHMDYYELDTNAALKTTLVTSVTDHNGLTAFYKTLRIKNFPNDTIENWEEAKFGYRIKLPEKTDELRIYIWNPKDVSMLLDNINIVLYRIKEDAEINPDQVLR